MSEELKLKFLALGLLSASAIGGEACKDCPHNIPRMSAALLTGDGEALRDCAKLLFKDCELVPVGTKARIAELESAIRRCCRNCWAAPAPDAAQCRLCGLKKALKGAGDVEKNS